MSVERLYTGCACCNATRLNLDGAQSMVTLLAIAAVGDVQVLIAHLCFMHRRHFEDSVAVVRRELA